MSNTNEKNLQALQEVSEKIQDYLGEFKDVSGLYQTAAKAMAQLLWIQKNQSNLVDVDLVVDMVQDYICILDLLEPLRKGGQA